MKQITLITAPYCGACKAYYKKIFEPVQIACAFRWKMDVRMQAVDGMEHPEIARRHRITNVPALVITDEAGTQVIRKGLPDRDKLCEIAGISPLTDEEAEGDGDDLS